MDDTKNPSIGKFFLQFIPYTFRDMILVSPEVNLNDFILLYLCFSLGIIIVNL